MRPSRRAPTLGPATDARTHRGKPVDPISMLVHTYADAVCTRNADQWGSTWTADAEWDMGQIKLSGRD